MAPVVRGAEESSNAGPALRLALSDLTNGHKGATTSARKNGHRINRRSQAGARKHSWERRSTAPLVDTENNCSSTSRQYWQRSNGARAGSKGNGARAGSQGRRRSGRSRRGNSTASLAAKARAADGASSATTTAEDACSSRECMSDKGYADVAVPEESQNLLQEGQNLQQDTKPEVEPCGHGAVSCLPEKPPEALSIMAALYRSRCSTTSLCPEEDIDGVLADLVDSFLHASHSVSVQQLPEPKHLASKILGIEREAVLHWLVQACDIMNFHENILYTTVLILDRYCVADGVMLSMDRIQKILMAALCTVIKVCAVQDELGFDDPYDRSLREILAHLCHGQVSFTDILHAEYEVLRALDFKVSTPSALDFLDVLSTPLSSPSESLDTCVPRSLADFLLQLSLFNISIHYQYPHVILAAAALYVALVSLGASPELIQSLLAGVTSTGLDMQDATVRIGECAYQLHGLWIDFAHSKGTTVPSLMKKLCRGKWNQEMFLQPPALGLLPYSAMAMSGALDAEGKAPAVTKLR